MEVEDDDKIKIEIKKIKIEILIVDVKNETKVNKYKLEWKMMDDDFV